MEKLCKTVGELVSEGCKKAGGQSGAYGDRGQPSRKPGACYVCQDTSHWAAQCPIRYGDFAAVRKVEIGDRHGDRKCYNCGQPGHGYRACLEVGRGAGEPSHGGPRDSFKGNGVTRKGTNKTPTFVRTSYGGKEWIAQLDTGEDCTVFPRGMINEKNVSPANGELTTVSGEKLRVVGSARILLQVGGIVVWTAGLVVDGIQRLILGSDWLETHDAAWLFSEGTCYIYGLKLTLLRGTEVDQHPIEYRQWKQQCLLHGRHRGRRSLHVQEVVRPQMIGEKRRRNVRRP